MFNVEFEHFVDFLDKFTRVKTTPARVYGRLSLVSKKSGKIPGDPLYGVVIKFYT